MALIPLVLLGGAVGAIVRFLIGRALNGTHPWGTFAVNVTGAGLLGLLAGLGNRLPQELLVLLGTGLCGALTTWSTLATEIVALPRWRGLTYAASTVACGLATASLGWWLAGLTGR
jgi:CrcB protein